MATMVYVPTCTSNFTWHASVNAPMCPLANRGSMYVDKDILQAANVVSVELQPSGVDATRIQDMAQLFGLMVLVLVGVWGAKQLLRIFSDDTTKD